MKRSLKALHLIAILTLTVTVSCTENVPSRPNIIYMMADDHASNAISAYGSRLAEYCPTPNIDRIASEGALLTAVYCANSICAPSRATILTGQHSHHNGVLTLAYAIDPAKETYPKIFQAGGYQTAMIGKWHLATEPQGFDYYCVLPNQGRYEDPEFLEKGDANYPPYDPNRDKSGNLAKERIVIKGHSTDVIMDKCLDWLEKRDPDKPFYLSCHFKAAHGPFTGFNPKYAAEFMDEDVPEPNTLFEDMSHRSPGSRGFGSSLTYGEFAGNPNRIYPVPEELYDQTRERYQKYLKDYLRLIRGLDDNVGRLLEYLDESGLTENTIVVYTSDQGMFLGEHNLSDKRWIWEEAFRMPFIVRYPGSIEPGIKINELISNVDFAPTFLDMAGLPALQEADGSSFKNILYSGKAINGWRDAVYYRYWMHWAHLEVPAHYGIRTDRYKLILFYGLPLGAIGAMDDPLTPAAWELYDLEKDPFETLNVYGKPEYEQIAADLKKKLYEMKSKIGDKDDKYPELIEKIKNIK